MAKISPDHTVGDLGRFDIGEKWQRASFRIDLNDDSDCELNTKSPGSQRAASRSDEILANSEELSRPLRNGAVFRIFRTLGHELSPISLG